MRFHCATASKGWKNAAMLWISPRRSRGALRYHASLKAAKVARFSRPLGKTGGATANCLGRKFRAWPRNLRGSLSRGADQPRVRTDRPKEEPWARQSIQATEYVYR